MPPGNSQSPSIRMDFRLPRRTRPSRSIQATTTSGSTISELLSVLLRDYGFLFRDRASSATKRSSPSPSKCAVLGQRLARSRWLFLAEMIAEAPPLRTCTSIPNPILQGSDEGFHFGVSLERPMPPGSNTFCQSLRRWAQREPLGSNLTAKTLIRPPSLTNKREQAAPRGWIR